jgi:hypothetical protein
VFLKPIYNRAEDSNRMKLKLLGLTAIILHMGAAACGQGSPDYWHDGFVAEAERR